MARSSEYLLEGYTYHLTHRCHNRQFLLRFGRDRETYREWLREGVRRYRVPIYAYCITSNHVHLLVHAENRTSVSELMHLAAGSTAKQYNLRKERVGSMWEHPFQCTVIEDGRHLLNCLCYVDLNIVRAGAVAHPREWRWCGYDELMGARKRYTLIDRDRLAESVGAGSFDQFSQMYQDAIDQRIRERHLVREPYWTESLAVGSEGFVKSVSSRYSHRSKLDFDECPSSRETVWAVRESRSPYTQFSGGKNAV